MANHQKPIPDPTKKPEAPPVQWLTLVKVRDGDYRVFSLTTKGLPAEARRGEESQTFYEGEERFKSAAADLFDSVDSIEGELFVPTHRVEQTCQRCGVTWLVAQLGGCPRCEAWDKAIDLATERMKTSNPFHDLKVQL